jgi:hypothetical protein
MSVVDLGKEISQHFFQSFSPFPSLLLFINLISWAAHFSDCIWWRPTSLLPREWRTLWKKVRIHCCNFLSHLLQYCLSPFPDFRSVMIYWTCHKNNSMPFRDLNPSSHGSIPLTDVSQSPSFHMVLLAMLQNNCILSKKIRRCHSVPKGTLPHSAFASVSELCLMSLSTPW